VPPGHGKSSRLNTCLTPHGRRMMARKRQNSKTVKRQLGGSSPKNVATLTHLLVVGEGKGPGLEHVVVVSAGEAGLAGVALAVPHLRPAPNRTQRERKRERERERERDRNVADAGRGAGKTCARVRLAGARAGYLCGRVTPAHVGLARFSSVSRGPLSGLQCCPQGWV